MDADNLSITVWPSLAGHEGEVSDQVLGFYQGGDDSVFQPFSYPKRIVLIQAHIEMFCASREELIAQINETLVHEVAHYFGISHGEMNGTKLDRSR